MNISNLVLILMLFTSALLIIILVLIAAMFYVLHRHNNKTAGNITAPDKPAAELSINDGAAPDNEAIKDANNKSDIVFTQQVASPQNPSQLVFEEHEQSETDDLEDEVEADDENILVVIAAAIAYLGMNNGKKYSIRSIRRVKRSPLVRSAWANSGVLQNTQPF